jgi:predicted aspartyl protease
MPSAGLTPAPAQAIRMLVDTGASHTSIDQTVLQTMNLQPTGSIGMLTPSTKGVAVQAMTYDVDLIIFGHNTISKAFNNHSVSECHVAAQGILGLIGRDILAEGLLSYSGPGRHFYLSF